MNSHSAKLLETLTAHAEHGRPCPSLPQLGQSMRVSITTVKRALDELKAAGAITWRMKNAPIYGQLRIVTIKATGKSTGEPQPARPKVDRRSSFTPTFYGPPVRRLTGEEFKRRAAELIARDQAERRKGGTT